MQSGATVAGVSQASSCMPAARKCTAGTCCQLQHCGCWQLAPSGALTIRSGRFHAANSAAGASRVWRIWAARSAASPLAAAAVLHQRTSRLGFRILRHRQSSIGMTVAGDKGRDNSDVINWHQPEPARNRAFQIDHRPPKQSPISTDPCSENHLQPLACAHVRAAIAETGEGSGMQPAGH